MHGTLTHQQGGLPGPLVAARRRSKCVEQSRSARYNQRSGGRREGISDSDAQDEDARAHDPLRIRWCPRCRWVPSNTACDDLGVTSRLVS